MPTGYTADIKDGIDFKTYAMNCARAFGACVMLRDEPGVLVQAGPAVPCGCFAAGGEPQAR